MSKRLRRLGILVAAVAVTALLVGCSGAGLGPEKVTGASVQSVAGDQLTMLVLLRAWLGVLYPPPPTTTGTPDVNWDFSDPNGLRVFGTDSNGNPFDIFLGNDDTGHSTTFTQDGVQMRSTWEAASGWPVVTRRLRDEFPGMTLEYTSTMDFSGGGQAPTTWDGTQTLSDGRTLHFQMHWNMVDKDTLRLQIPSANLDIQAEIPVHFVVDRNFIPLPSSQVTGTVQTATGNLTFGLKGQEINWNELTIAGDDIAGTFTLGAKMAGSGQFTQNGAMAGALNWPDTLVGRLDLTSMSSVEVTPLAAARDLAIDKWVAGMAGLSPGAFQ